MLPWWLKRMDIHHNQNLYNRYMWNFFQFRLLSGFSRIEFLSERKKPFNDLNPFFARFCCFISFWSVLDETFISGKLYWFVVTTTLDITANLERRKARAIIREPRFLICYSPAELVYNWNWLLALFHTVVSLQTLQKEVQRIRRDKQTWFFLGFIFWLWFCCTRNAIWENYKDSNTRTFLFWSTCDKPSES